MFQTQNKKIRIYQQNIATCIKVWAVVVTLLLALVLWFGSYFIVNPPIVYVGTSTPKPVTEVDHKTSVGHHTAEYYNIHAQLYCDKHAIRNMIYIDE